MTGRYNNKNDPLGLNAGFALPDPKNENWKAPEDCIPQAGTKKNARFLADNMWATTPKRRGRMHMGVYMSGSDAGSASSVASLDRKAPAPKAPPRKAPQLGEGAWGDWGVNASAASPYLQESQKEKEKNKVNGVALGFEVPRGINGMNKVLAERAKAASANTAAAYANGTAPRTSETTACPAEATNAPAKVSVPAHIPPYERKKLAAQSSSPSAPAAVAPSRTPAESPETLPIARPDSIGDDINAALQDQSARRRDATSRPGTANLPANPIVARPPHGNHFAVPADPEARRPSSTTLVNGVDEDDETLARRLQAEEYGVEEIGQTRNTISGQLENFKRNVSLVAQGPSLYDRLHKVHEISWKQDFLNLPALRLSNDALFDMDEKQFQNYQSEVSALFLYQWNLRQDRVQKTLSAQKDMRIKSEQRHNINDIMYINGSEFDHILEKISSAYIPYRASLPGYAKATPGKHDSCRSDKEFQVDVYGSEDEDEDSDLIIFKGRG